jgi:hypothetical protein
MRIFWLDFRLLLWACEKKNFLDSSYHKQLNILTPMFLVPLSTCTAMQQLVGEVLQAVWSKSSKSTRPDQVAGNSG